MNDTRKTIIKIFSFAAFLSSLIAIAYFIISGENKNVIRDEQNIENLTTELLKDRSDKEYLRELMLIARPLSNKASVYEVLPGNYLLEKEFLPSGKTENTVMVDNQKAKDLITQVQQFYFQENRIPPAFLADLSVYRDFNFSLMPLPSLSATYSVFKRGKDHKDLPMLVSFFGCAFLQAYKAQGLVTLDGNLLFFFKDKKFLSQWNSGSQAGHCLSLNYNPKASYAKNVSPLFIAPDVGKFIETSRRKDPAAVIKTFWNHGYDIFPVRHNAMLWSGIVYEHLEHALENGTITQEELKKRVKKIIAFKISSGAIKNWVNEKIKTETGPKKMALEYRMGVYQENTKTREKMLMGIPDLRSINAYLNEHAFAKIILPRKKNNKEKTNEPIKKVKFISPKNVSNEKGNLLSVEHYENIFTDIPIETIPVRFRKKIKKLTWARDCDQCLYIDSFYTRWEDRKLFRKNINHGTLITPYPEYFLNYFEGDLFATMVPANEHKKMIRDLLQQKLGFQNLIWPQSK